MKKILMVAMCVIGSLSIVGARPFFNKNKDVLLAQFDSRPDPDDIHAIAALGSLLGHDDFDGINYLAVAGAYGTQGNKAKYIPAPKLFKMAFGEKNSKWVDAHNNWDGSVTYIKNKIKPILEGGGKVWVQEAGQSNITADWVRALLSDGISESVVKDNVIVVQHSEWNEDYTASADLNYVKKKTTYQAVDDGNRGGSGGSGPDTPRYTSGETKLLTSAKTSANSYAKKLWIEADRVIQDHGHLPSHSKITSGGVDFSDCVENWWIFDIANAGSVAAFWSTFVTNSTGSDGKHTESSETESEELSKDSLVGQVIALKSKANNKYVCADKGLDSTNVVLTANRTTVGSWEKFDVIDASGDLIVLKAAVNNKYVVSEAPLDYSLAAKNGTVVNKAKFTLVVNNDGSISLKAKKNSKFVSADKNTDAANWPLISNKADNSGSDTKFLVEIQ